MNEPEQFLTQFLTWLSQLDGRVKLLEHQLATALEQQPMVVPLAPLAPATPFTVAPRWPRMRLRNALTNFGISFDGRTLLSTVLMLNPKGIKGFSAATYAELLGLLVDSGTDVGLLLNSPLWTKAPRRYQRAASFRHELIRSLRPFKVERSDVTTGLVREASV